MTRNTNGHTIIFFSFFLFFIVYFLLVNPSRRILFWLVPTQWHFQFLLYVFCCVPDGSKLSSFWAWQRRPTAQRRRLSESRAVGLDFSKPIVWFRVIIGCGSPKRQWRNGWGQDGNDMGDTIWELKGNDQAILRKKNSGSKEWPFSHPLFIQNNYDYDKIQ